MGFNVEIRIYNFYVYDNCYHVLQAFNDAYNLVEQPESGEETIAPYKFKNDTGQTVTLKLENTFEVGSWSGGDVLLIKRHKLQTECVVSLVFTQP